MRREPLNELMQAHARLCHELQIKREDITNILREMRGDIVSFGELEAHRAATAAFEEVKKRLSTVSMKLAAHQ